MIDKKELRRLAEAATPGPWKECGHSRGGCICGMVWSHAADLPVAEAWRGDQEVPEPAEGAKSNAAFMASANPSTIISLLDELEQCQKDAERWRYYSRRLSPMVGADQTLINSTVDDAIDRDAKESSANG